MSSASAPSGRSASLRAGDRPRPAPPVIRPERRGALQHGICRRLRHPVRLHGEARTRAAAAPARNLIQVKATSCPADRDALEIRFPRIAGYRVELPEERLEAIFNASSCRVTPDPVSPSVTKNEGIIGEGVELTSEAPGKTTPVGGALYRALMNKAWREHRRNAVSPL